MTNDTCCNFGEHLTIDGYKGSLEKLNDKEIVLKCLDELPDLLEMKKLAEPQVYFAPSNDKKDCGGWSGFVVIAESHISIHTFPKRGFVSIDVYTCKNGVDRKFITDYFIGKFELKDVETHFINRGTKYPVEDIY
jgi:S-adenosylmethionine decarboxylase